MMNGLGSAGLSGRWPRLLCLLIAVATCVSTTANGQDVDRVAFVGATVVPMDRERALADHTVIVQGGVIEAVGPSAEVRVPADAVVVDAAGLYLMPGLADMHTHATQAEDLVPYAAHGVTTILNMGGADALRGWRDEVRAGSRFGPQILLGWFIDGGNSRGGVATVEAARAAVGRAAASGYEYMKVYNSLSTEQFDAIVEEADAHGLTVIGHGVRDPGMEHLLENGMRLVAHGEEFIYTFFANRPDRRRIDAATELVLSSGAYVLPNLSAYEIIAKQWGKPDVVDTFLERSDAQFQHPAHRRTWLQRRYANRTGSIDDRLEFLRTMTKAFADAGVPLLAGTDSPGIPGMYAGSSMHDDLRNLVTAGLTPYQALSAATRVAGEFVAATTTGRLPFGTIQSGQRADLLLLRADPLASIDAIREIEGVMTAGRWYPLARLGEEMLALRDSLR